MNELYQENLEDLKVEHFIKAVKAVTEKGLTSFAPLGASGDDILLSGKKQGGRESSVSIRLHSSGVELLCTNKQGDFLFYGKYHSKLGADFIGREHFRTFELIKQLIPTHSNRFPKKEVDSRNAVQRFFDWISTWKRYNFSI